MITKNLIRKEKRIELNSQINCKEELNSKKRMIL